MKKGGFLARHMGDPSDNGSAILPLRRGERRWGAGRPEADVLGWKPVPDPWALRSHLLALPPPGSGDPDVVLSIVSPSPRTPGPWEGVQQVSVEGSRKAGAADGSFTFSGRRTKTEEAEGERNRAGVPPGSFGARRTFAKRQASPPAQLRPHRPAAPPHRPRPDARRPPPAPAPVAAPHICTHQQPNNHTRPRAASRSGQPPGPPPPPAVGRRPCARPPLASPRPLGLELGAGRPGRPRAGPPRSAGPGGGEAGSRCSCAAPPGGRRGRGDAGTRGRADGRGSARRPRSALTHHGPAGHRARGPGQGPAEPPRPARAAGALRALGAAVVRDHDEVLHGCGPRPGQRAGDRRPRRRRRGLQFLLLRRRQPRQRRPRPSPAAPPLPAQAPPLPAPNHAPPRSPLPAPPLLDPVPEAAGPEQRAAPGGSRPWSPCSGVALVRPDQR